MVRHYLEGNAVEVSAIHLDAAVDGKALPVHLGVTLLGWLEPPSVVVDGFPDVLSVLRVSLGDRRGYAQWPVVYVEPRVSFRVVIDEDGFVCEPLFELIKAALAVLGPFELRVVFGEVSQRCRDVGVGLPSLLEHVGRTKLYRLEERLDLALVRWHRPLFDVLDLLRVRRHAVFGEGMSGPGDLGLAELALLLAESQTVVVEPLDRDLSCPALGRTSCFETFCPARPALGPFVLPNVLLCGILEF